ncbi:MAG: hypothetical protein IPG71_05100 [bacterium]|nr:hypothetical protein [bacterium]
MGRQAPAEAGLGPAPAALASVPLDLMRFADDWTIDVVAVSAKAEAAFFSSVDAGPAGAAFTLTMSVF